MSRHYCSDGWRSGSGSRHNSRRRRGTGKYIVMDLVLDLEAANSLPRAPQAGYIGARVSLHEKGRVLGLALSIMGQATAEGSMLPAPQTNQCLSLSPTGSREPRPGWGSMAGLFCPCCWSEATEHSWT